MERELQKEIDKLQDIFRPDTEIKAAMKEFCERMPRFLDLLAAYWVAPIRDATAIHLGRGKALNLVVSSGCPDDEIRFVDSRGKVLKTIRFEDDK